MTTGSMGYDISGAGNELLQEAFHFYARHLVGLALLSQPLSRGRTPKGSATCFFRSGFIIEFARKWYWTTAGHVIDGICYEARARWIRRDRSRAPQHGSRCAHEASAEGLTRYNAPPIYRKDQLALAEGEHRGHEWRPSHWNAERLRWGSDHCSPEQLASQTANCVRVPA